MMQSLVQTNDCTTNFGIQQEAQIFQLEIINNLPTIFNGIPVKRNWKDAGGKPKSFLITPYGNFKLVQCSSGYVLLCIGDGCKNLALNLDFKCKSHNKGQEIYTVCRNIICFKRPLFGYEYKKPLFCKDHKTPDMIDVIHEQCKTKECTKRPTFGFIGKKAEYCKDHKHVDMIDIVNKQCKFLDCNKQPNFGYKGQKAEYCKDHKSEEMIDVNNKRCEFPDCMTHPNFGFLGQKAQYCISHKHEGMVDVNSKNCEFSDCTKQPVFGYKGQSAQYCTVHKHEGMVDVHNKICESPNCIKHPNFGYEGGIIQYCSTHKIKEMINITSKRCKFPDCMTNPIFGYAGETVQYCSLHKQEEMIDIVHKRCEFQDCDIRPVFGFINQPPQYCSTHRYEGMIDVKSRRCEFIDCMKHPSFGYDGNPPQYCSTHKYEGMIDVKSKRCEFIDCKKRPTFGYKGHIAQKCKDHKSKEMINVIHKRCEYFECSLHPTYGKLYSKTLISCIEHSSLNYYSRKKLNPVCQVINCTNAAYFIASNDLNFYPVRCHSHHHFTDIELIFKTCPNCMKELHFPSDKKVCMNCGYYRERKLYHFKETMVKHFFTSNDILFIYDKTVSPFGSKRRPDFQIEAKFGVIIVEVDEHQHKNKYYNQEEEVNRMFTIYQDIQQIKPDLQVIFIRFNPDEYTGPQYKLRERYKYLSDLIMHFINQAGINVPLAQLKLFYDGFTGNPIIEPLLYYTL